MITLYIFSDSTPEKKQRDMSLVKPEPVRMGMKHSSSHPNLKRKSQHSSSPLLPSGKHASPKSDSSLLSPSVRRGSPALLSTGSQAIPGIKRKGGRDTQPLDLSSKKIKLENPDMAGRFLGNNLTYLILKTLLNLSLSKFIIVI